MDFKSIKMFQQESNSATLEIFGNYRVIITDCKSVIDYSKENISLDLGDLKLKISGKNLVADSFVFEQTDISGEIDKLEFF